MSNTRQRGGAKTPQRLKCKTEYERRQALIEFAQGIKDRAEDQYYDLNLIANYVQTHFMRIMKEG